MPPRRTGPTIIRVDCDDNRRSHSHGATIGCQRPLLSTTSTLKPNRGHHRGLRWRVLCGGGGSTSTFPCPPFGGPQVDHKRDRLLGCQSIRSRYCCAPEQRRSASVSSAGCRSRARGQASVSAGVARPKTVGATTRLRCPTMRSAGVATLDEEPIHGALTRCRARPSANTNPI